MSATVHVTDYDQCGKDDLGEKHRWKGLHKRIYLW